MKTLYLMQTDEMGIYDFSTKGVSTKIAGDVKTSKYRSKITLSRGSLELSRHPSLDSLQVFTIDVQIKPAEIDQRRNILEAQTPGIALYIDPQNRVVGSVNTANGQETVDSGDYKVAVGRTIRIRFTRSERGETTLFIDGRRVGAKTTSGPITPIGENGFKVGVGTDGVSHQFIGDILDLQIRDYVYAALEMAVRKARAEALKAQIATILGRTVVLGYVPDESHARLEPVRDIMKAVGVQKLDDLETLKISTQTVMYPGTVIIAQKKLPQINWGDIATKFVAGNLAVKRELLATHLINANSITTLRKMRIVASRTTTVGPRTIRSLRTQPSNVFEAITKVNNVLTINDGKLIAKLGTPEPASWPTNSAQKVYAYSINTIPVDSAVMIGGTIDLTNTTLIVEPSVSTFYLIADKLVCGPNATVTWRRPGGTTPPRSDDPDLNGTNWSGVHTAGGSRDGLDGGDGSPGGPGIAGANGYNAPSLEIWAKEITKMPTIDLNGEDGIKGGRGQGGGKGGHGADGHVGEKTCFIWCWCSEDPGDGGDGGDGGNGGKGGSGGNGGNSGRVTVGVLEGTIQNTITAGPFTIKNQGGPAGVGGDGGPGGAGGWGGVSGIGEYCHDAVDGHNGAQGQPGSSGSPGSSKGLDNELEFFEFTEDAWNDLLTRPWLSDVTPPYAFPGDTIILRGSKFSSNDTVMLGNVGLSPTVNADESVSVDVPLDIGGGQKTLFVKRTDGTESNRLLLYIKPQLDSFSTLTQGAEITLNGRAFLSGASVLVDGSANPSTSVTANQVKFRMPGTGGAGSSGGTVALQVKNPDGLVSNSRSASIPAILEIPFKFGMHNLPFKNPTDGVPTWSTFEDTFGAAEVWHELLDPVFGHPMLTGAFYLLYEYFLKGKSNGGLATGFCTAMSSFVADKFWTGATDTITIQKPSIHTLLTAIHGKLLSRESLIHFHDQSREEISRVEKTYREIEATFLRGCDRYNAPMLFFIPSGAIWDSGYIDGLGDSHCVFPYKFVYPSPHPGPQLSADMTTTTTDPDTVELYVWDCNEPTSDNCKLVFKRNGNRIDFEYYPNQTTPKFSSQSKITLGMMSNGAYHLAD